jgi:predicted DNA-binding transcriptional regulator AlpA
MDNDTLKNALAWASDGQGVTSDERIKMLIDCQRALIERFAKIETIFGYLAEGLQAHQAALDKLEERLAQRDRLLTEGEVAQILGVALNTLRNWRAEQRGPRFVKLGTGRGAPVRYYLSDINAFAK